MGQGEPEAFRARIYDGVDEAESARRAFVRTLHKHGVLDSPGYDQWTSALNERGWLRYEMEPNPNGPGRWKRWWLSESGQRALRHVLEGE